MVYHAHFYQKQHGTVEAMAALTVNSVAQLVLKSRSICLNILGAGITSEYQPQRIALGRGVYHRTAFPLYS